jgi:hypothetical protein
MSFSGEILPRSCGKVIIFEKASLFNVVKN